MKVIENKYTDKVFPKKVVCEHCGSILLVERDDCERVYRYVTNDYRYTYRCPCCDEINEFIETD